MESPNLWAALGLPKNTEFEIPNASFEPIAFPDLPPGGLDKEFRVKVSVRVLKHGSRIRVQRT